MTRVLSVIPNQFTYGSDNVRLAMGKGLDLSVSQPLRVRLHLGKKGGRIGVPSGKDHSDSSGGCSMLNASPRQGKGPRQDFR